MARIKKGDTVVVLAGSQKGSTGEVLRVIPKKNQAVVQGVNVKTKHQKPSPANPNGGIIKQEAPVDLSNLAPSTGAAATEEKKPAAKKAAPKAKAPKAEAAETETASAEGEEAPKPKKPRAKKAEATEATESTESAE
jgi:large subunit ribosomal protein L24